jgi:NADH-quinone oxidoreductase subunit N
VGKFVLFTATVQAGFTWLAIIGLINTVLSLYYYLRVIAPLFLQPPQQPPEKVNGYGTAVAVVSALASIALGIGAFFLLDLESPLQLLH